MTTVQPRTNGCSVTGDVTEVVGRWQPAGDLSVRLRRIGNAGSTEARVALEAANEIERLQALLDDVELGDLCVRCGHALNDQEVTPS